MLLFVRCLSVSDSVGSSAIDELLCLSLPSSINCTLNNFLSEFHLLRPNYLIQKILFAGQQITFKDVNNFNRTLNSFNIVKECTVHILVKQLFLYGSNDATSSTNSHEKSAVEADSDELPGLTVSPTSPHYRPYFIRQPTEEEVQYDDCVIIKLNTLQIHSKVNLSMQLYFELFINNTVLRSNVFSIEANVENSEIIQHKVILLDEFFVLHIDLSKMETKTFFSLDVNHPRQIQMRLLQVQEPLTATSHSAARALSSFKSKSSNNLSNSKLNKTVGEWSFHCDQIPRDQTIAAVKQFKLDSSNDSNIQIHFIIDRSSITAPVLRETVIRLFQSSHTLNNNQLNTIIPGLTVNMLLGKELFQINRANSNNKSISDSNLPANPSKSLSSISNLSTIPALHHLYFLLLRHKLKINNYRTARKVIKILTSSQAIQGNSNNNVELFPTRCIWLTKYSNESDSNNLTLLGLYSWMSSHFAHRVKQFIPHAVESHNQTHYSIYISFKQIEDSLLFVLELVNLWPNNPSLHIYSITFIAPSANLYPAKINSIQSCMAAATALLQLKKHSKELKFCSTSSVWFVINDNNLNNSNETKSEAKESYYINIWSSPSWINNVNLLYSIQLNQSSCLIMKSSLHHFTIEIMPKVRNGANAADNKDPSVYLTFPTEAEYNHWLNLLKQYRILSVAAENKLNHNISLSSIIPIQCQTCETNYSIAHYYIKDSQSQIKSPTNLSSNYVIPRCFWCLQSILHSQLQSLLALDVNQIQRVPDNDLKELNCVLLSYSLQDLQDLLTITQYSKITGLITLAHMQNQLNNDKNSILYTECPSCASSLELDITTGNDYENSRYYCYNCSNDFCRLCSAYPFHSSMNCKEFEEYKSAKKCRYCGDVIQDKQNSTVCCIVKEECKDRYELSCSKVHPICGHKCMGLVDETRCPPCLFPSCISKSKSPLHQPFSPSIAKPLETLAAATELIEFDVASDSFCSICYSEELINAPILLLACNHIFHYHCLLNRLATSASKHVIDLTKVKCPLCQQLIQSKHSYECFDLLIAPLLNFFHQCKEIAIKQLQIHYTAESKENHLSYHPAAAEIEEVLHDSSFFACATCGKAFFAGRKLCQVINPDQNNNNDNSEEDKKAEKSANDLHLCTDCLPPTNVTECSIHGPNFLVFKCRYCCSLATNFCFNRVHFCNNCHEGTKWHQLCSTTGKNKKTIPNYQQCPAISQRIKAISLDRQYKTEQEREAAYSNCFISNEDVKKCRLGIRHPPHGFEFGLGCSKCQAGAES
jgi:hypothetical protein